MHQHSLVSSVLSMQFAKQTTSNNGEILPPNQQLPDGSKLTWGQAFSENVRLLLSGPNVLGFNAFLLANVGTEEMAFESQVLVPCGHLRNIDQRQTALIVFKDSTANKTVRQNT